jgi:Tfp pilus assembly protein PilE
MLIDIIIVLTILFILALILAPIYYYVKRDRYSEKNGEDKDA